MRWYYVDTDGNSQGPFTIEQIEEFNQGIEDFYVYTEGFSEWRLASTVAEFTQAPSSIPTSPLSAPPILTEYSPASEQGAKRKEAPATVKQLYYLKKFEYVPNGSLTKREASMLLTQFEEDPERLRIRDEYNAREQEKAWDFEDNNTAWCLHQKCEDAVRELEKADKEDKADYREELQECLKSRVNFWMDTFTVNPEEFDTSQWGDLFDQYGRYFNAPTKKQIQNILAALDAHAPTWDQDRPEAFFATLQASFPDLQRK